MNKTPHPASLQSQADQDLARRSLLTGLFYLVGYAVIVAFTPYTDDHPQSVLLFGVTIVLATIGRSYLVWRFDDIYEFHPSRWRLGFVTGTVILAAAWGLFCMLAVMHYELQWTAMLILLSTAGLSTGAVTTLSIDMRLVAGYLALMLLPSVLVTAFLHTSQAYAVMLLLLGFFSFLQVAAKRLNREYWDALHNTRLLDRHARELEASNRELESYSYSLAHDLRAPLRSVISFSQVLLEDARDKLNNHERDELHRVIAAGKYMSRLIDDILELSRITRARFKSSTVDLSALATKHIRHLSGNTPERKLECRIEPDIQAVGDARLLGIAIRNLIDNAWKFTGKLDYAEISFSTTVKDGETLYHINDNGAGFDMQYADKLFKPFNRLHTVEEFPGTGIGLAKVQRIVQRHGGRVWAESVPGKGSSFTFVLGSKNKH